MFAVYAGTSAIEFPLKLCTLEVWPFSSDCMHFVHVRKGLNTPTFQHILTEYLCQAVCNCVTVCCGCSLLNDCNGRSGSSVESRLQPGLLLIRLRGKLR